jgi:malate dehydrogenase (oxaloacetate-decarboxylating)
MRMRVIPILAPVTKGRAGDEYDETSHRGMAVLNSPRLNKGTAFTLKERKALGLTGLLPPEITTLAEQASHAWLQYEELADALSKNAYLTALHDRNDVLFYRLFSEHLCEMIPIVNDLIVGVAIEHYRHECRRPRGVYLSIDHPESIEEAFINFGARPGEIDLIIATDAERVPGIGDCGVGGIEVPIGKLAIYTAAGGVDPARAIPVMLDVGTDRERLLNDSTYIGNRHPRVRAERYEAFIEAYVIAATRLFPHALVTWVDLAPANARRILEKYRGRCATFSDDLQGAGALALAAAISALRVCGTALINQRVVIFGEGSAARGIADQLRDAMILQGLSREQAERHFWCVDRLGLTTTATIAETGDHEKRYARLTSESRGWKNDGSGIQLHEVVRRVRPTILIGSSALPGMLTETVVKTMAAHTERPIIFTIGTPPQGAPKPAELIAWTDGRALTATTIRVAPVTWNGITYVIGQINNAMLYPGLALGAIVARAAIISPGMVMAAASALSSIVTVRQPGAPLLPQVDDLRGVSAIVAVAVAEAAQAEGLARVHFVDIVQQVQDAMWQPVYRPVRAV